MARPDLYVNDEVLFIGPWNSFLGQRGRVAATDPHLMVRVEGDTYPMRFSDHEVVLADELNLTGAE